MTEYDVYLVGFEYRATRAEQAALIDTVEANSPDQAITKGERIVEDNPEIIVAAGYNRNDNVDEVKQSIRVYPSNYRSGV